MVARHGRYNLVELNYEWGNIHYPRTRVGIGRD